MRPWWRAVAWFLAVLLVAGYLGWDAVRTVYVSVLGSSAEFGELQKAVRMDPTDPELQHRLGVMLADSMGDADRTEGLKHLRIASELDPYAARYWSDLAWVCEMARDESCATDSVGKAVKLSPMTPQLHWVAANTYLRAGEDEAAMAEFRRLLEIDPSYAAATFHICLGALGDPDLILHKVLPPGPDPQLKLAYLNFLITNELADQAHAVWVSTVQTGRPFPLSMATPYLDQLLEMGRFDQAKEVWNDLGKLGVIPQSAAGKDGNLIFNGDFEQAPLNMGFDWRVRPAPYIAVDFSDPSTNAGKHCARIDFTVSKNEEYGPLYEIVPVAAHQTYVLSAQVRSQDITSDSGPLLQVADLSHPQAAPARTDTTVGTTPWHPISVQFCTASDTKLLQVALVRVRSRIFPTEITGSFWIDQIALKAVGSGLAASCKAGSQ